MLVLILFALSIVVHETLTFPLQLQGEAREILTGLLQKDPSKRIGSQGANEIRRHRFFKDLDWSKVEKREIEPRFRPSVQSKFLICCAVIRTPNLI